jgi:uncharacterized protein with PQ loop repeat
VQAIGWLSSFILIATIAKQVHKEWKCRSVEGISSWLFVGQTAASTGFTLYSWLVRDWVFVVTNAVMLLSALTGWAIYRRNARLSGTSRLSGA